MMNKKRKKTVLFAGIIFLFFVLDCVGSMVINMDVDVVKVKDISIRVTG